MSRHRPNPPHLAEAAPAPERDVPPLRHRLLELAGVFLKLGVIGFGGPAAHIALMEDELVRRRGWLSREAFLDLLAAANLIPGPNSTELAIFIGRERAGLPGLLVAGVCFILPAMLIVMAIAWAYQRFGALPQVNGVLYGVKPVIIAVVAQALWGLGRASVKNASQATLLVLALAAGAFGVHELLILPAAGLVALVVAWCRRTDFRPAGHAAVLPLPVSPLGNGFFAAAVPAATGVAAKSFGLVPLFLFFLKVGAVLYGSGYVLLAFLRADLVDRWGWLTEAQLLDAVAVGQVTPGPLFTTATFIGYLLGGVPAAVLATVGIFLPAFILVAVCSPVIPHLRRSKTVGAFLDGVVVASLALMAVVSWHLARAAIIDWPTALLALLSGVLLLHWRVNSVWLVLGGAVIGLVLSQA